jgi:hypothetical protein
MRVLGVGVPWTDRNRAKRAREVAVKDLIVENTDYWDEMGGCIDWGRLEFSQGHLYPGMVHTSRLVSRRDFPVRD